MTVHQAKGLAWDHVCFLSPGAGARRPFDDPPAWVELGGARLRLEGVRFDPYGGITPFPDPLARLGAKLHGHRLTEESARLLYVAITRARRSVTLGLPTRRRHGRFSERVTIATVARDAWLDPAFEGEGIARVQAVPLPEDRLRPTGWVDVSPAAPATWAVAHVAHEREERTPSAMGAHLEPAARAHIAESVVARVRLANGLHLGVARTDPPGADPETGTPLPGHRLGHLEASDWGEIAHGWLARWGFRGAADPTAVEDWLKEEWAPHTSPDPAVRDWLLAVSRTLARAGGPLWEQVTARDAQLHFELPLVGVGQQAGAEVLLSGRTDLIIERRGQRLTVVDFKAGASAPKSWETLADGASLKTYAPQLEAYADAFRRMGFKVEAVALWFVRTGTSVLWVP